MVAKMVLRMQPEVFLEDLLAGMVMHHLIAARDHCVEDVEPRPVSGLKLLGICFQALQEQIDHPGFAEDLHMVAEDVVIANRRRDALLVGRVSQLETDEDQRRNHRNRRDNSGNEIELLQRHSCAPSSVSSAAASVGNFSASKYLTRKSSSRAAMIGAASLCIAVPSQPGACSAHQCLANRDPK